MRWFLLLVLSLRLAADPFEEMVPSSAEEIAKTHT